MAFCASTDSFCGFDINFHYCPAKISDYFAPLPMTGLNFHVISIRRLTERDLFNPTDFSSFVVEMTAIMSFLSFTQSALTLCNYRHCNPSAKTEKQSV
jgi:hypothetical protein